MKRLCLILAAALASCQSPVVFSVTGQGRGDVRFDGDAMVVVGDMHGRAAMSVKGQPLVILPSWNVAEGHWYARRQSDGYERSAPLSEPLPSWARELYSPMDLQALADLGIALTFESPEQPPSPE